ncbi:MAG: glutamate synthase subunit beta [Rhizobiales bacterium]|nr:glutamate synthase subunit beta [Hyphomicrobiales bacterium]
MGKVTGFLEIDRQEQKYQPASDRIRHFREFTLKPAESTVKRQAARCMDCGVPFCQGDNGCPVENQIPDWNDLVYNGNWEEASANLHSTNNFPEFTGRICPAPCEAACTLNLEDAPVSIKSVEQAIADKAWAKGWIVPQPAAHKTGKSVAIIGAGPAGMAAGQQLARAGHDVHIYEREPRAGGLLTYGIPDFKMEKRHVNRRVKQMQGEGVRFHFGVSIGIDMSMHELSDKHDAVLICAGAEKPRDPEIPGMELAGVNYAMPFLVQQNRRVGMENAIPEELVTATGKNVVVVGGGDTASDCIGTSFRQGATSVTQMDIRPLPPMKENKLETWPFWPTRFTTSSSQAEGAKREFQAATLEFVSKGHTGRLTHVKCAKVDKKRRPIEGTEFFIKADLALIAIGFTGPEENTYLKDFNPELSVDKRGNKAIAANELNYRTSVDGVYAAGDVRRGQSLVVWAIREGRQAAHAIDLALMGKTNLPR